MFYISAKKYEISVFDGRASITYYGSTQVSSTALGMHAMSVSAELREAGEAAARKAEAESLTELLMERDALRDEVKRLKQSWSLEAVPNE